MLNIPVRAMLTSYRVACDTYWQVALNWLLIQGNVVPIPGAKSAAQVSYNIKIEEPFSLSQNLTSYI